MPGVWKCSIKTKSVLWHYSQWSPKMIVLPVYTLFKRYTVVHRFRLISYFDRLNGRFARLNTRFARIIG